MGKSKDKTYINNRCDVAIQNKPKRNNYLGSKEDTTKRNTTLGFTKGHEKMQSEDNDGCAEMDILELVDIPREEKAHRYLMTCVRYHQLLLQ
jgi:hypothetical protein